MKVHLMAAGVMGVTLALGSCGSGSETSGAAGAGGDSGPAGAAGTSGGAGAAGTSGGAGAGAGTSGGAGAAAAGTSGGAGLSGGAGQSMPHNGGSTLGGCAIFPSDDAWNQDVSGLTVNATWTQRLQTLVGTVKVHPDFGDTFGIPINVVPASQAAVPIVFDGYPEESDPGPYPFPPPATIMIEGDSATACGGDCHVLVVQQGTCMLYEGYGCNYMAGAYHCANGAKWDLTKESYGQRKEGWTSADAAGLAIMPGILRHAEAAAGPIKHAVRFTVNCTTNKYVKPATHDAIPTNKICDPKNPNPMMPPMGLRVRLKKSYVVAGDPVVQNILLGLQTYGMILADNGSNFFFQGDPDPGWTNDILDQLKMIPASAFEVVDASPLPP
jgi:hypothetical protein